MESCGEEQKNTHKRELRFAILELPISSLHIIGLLESSPKLRQMVRMGLKSGPKHLIRRCLYRMDTVGRSTFVGVVLRQRIFYFCCVISTYVHAAGRGRRCHSRSQNPTPIPFSIFINFFCRERDEDSPSSTSNCHCIWGSLI